MKIKVSHNSVELKLTLEDLDDLYRIVAAAEWCALGEKANTLSKRLKIAKEAANKLNWMDGI